MPKHNRQSVYEAVTQQILEHIEAGPEQWVKTWTHSLDTWLATNAQSNRPYGGINLLALALASAERGYTTNRWLTFKQAKALGGQVRKGSKGARVVLFKAYDKRERDDASQPLPKEAQRTDRRIFARAFYVFNVAQCDGLGQGLHHPPRTHSDASSILRASGARFADGSPCYDPNNDTVHLPPHNDFVSLDEYHAAAFHELVHWTHSRVGRERRTERWGDAAYAMEELVAELGAAMLCGICGIQAVPQHAAYLGHWMTVLKADSRAIFTAASDAQKAVNFLLDQAQAQAAE